MKRKMISAIAAALGVAMLLTACGKDKNTKTPEPEETPVVEEQEQTPPKVENDPEQQQQDVQQPDDVIVTDYGELKFPGMWTDRVQYEIEEDGADVKIHFTGAVDGAEAKLFSLCYGSVPEDGFEQGALLTDGDVVVIVSSVMYPIVPQEGWSEEATNELIGLQESINDLLVQIRAYPNFTGNF